MNPNQFAKFAWATLMVNFAVILWGAFVRATGSGAGCGSHWPLCNGEVVPRAPQVETMIEFGHRITSALAFFMIVALVIWAFRAFRSGSPVRLAAILALVFVLLEVVIGAGLIRFGWVKDDRSVARSVVMAIHLVNTFLLLGALTMTAWWGSGAKPAQFRGQGLAGLGWWLALAGTMVLGASGAITALGDTVFPAQSLAAGIQQEFAPGAHFLLRLRVWHPFIAISVGLYAVLVARTIKGLRPGLLTDWMADLQTALFIVQIVAGAINVALLAPVWMQLLHLALACAAWIGLVMLGLTAFAEREHPILQDGSPAGATA